MLTVALADLRLRWRRMLLSALAVALGVAFTAATLIYAATVSASYVREFAAQAANVDAAVLPDHGATLPLSDLAAVRAVPGVASAEGRLQGSVTLVSAGGSAVTATAIDQPADPRFRFYTVASGGGGVLVDSGTAALDHLSAGAPVTVTGRDGRTERLTVTGTADLGATGQAFAGSVLVLPAAAVRALTGTGGYQRIDVAAAPGVSQSALAARLAGLRLAGAHAEAGAQLAAALAEQNVGGEGLLSVGLLVFALVSLAVAALVIYNSFRILLAQRLREVALLRCVGAARRQVMTGLLAESAALGLVAAAAGVGVAALVVAAVNSGRVDLRPGTVALSLAVGVVVTAGAAALPAAAASGTAPAGVLQAPHEGRVRGVPGRIAAAVLLGGAGLALTAAGVPAGRDGPLIIAAGGTLFFLGFFAVSPLVVGPLATALGWLPARVLGAPMRLAVTGTRRNPSRTATTSVALTIGIGLMTLVAVVLSTASQFATSEMNRHFPADYLLSAGQSALPASVPASLRASPLIAETAGIRQRTVLIGGGPAPLMAVEPAAYQSLFMPEVASGSLSATARGTGGIALDQTLARQLGLAVGGRVTLAGRTFVVTSLFFQGVLSEKALISWPDFTRAFGPGGDSEVLVKARPGVSGTASAAVVDAAVAGHPQIEVTAEASLRAHMLASVHKLTGLFDGLLATSIVIALAGLANALSLSALERTRESALLRALGLTRRQLRQSIGLEAVLLGLIGAGAGVAFGAGFGWATGRAFVRADGGTVSFPVLQVVAYVALAGGAALAASVIPGRRAARLSVIEGLAVE